MGVLWHVQTVDLCLELVQLVQGGLDFFLVVEFGLLLGGARAGGRGGLFGS